MNYTKVILNGLTIVGISVRTRNTDHSADHDIAELWNRFLTENIFMQIPHRLTDTFYCVYNNYENQSSKGELTVTLGCPVWKVDKELPSDFVMTTTPKGHFYELSAVGALPDAAYQLWSTIQKNEPSLPRAYTTDFDVFHKDIAEHTEKAQILTYISVK